VTAYPPPGKRLPDGDLRRVLEQFDAGLVVRRMEAGFRQLPAYTRFTWPVDRDALVRWNVDLALLWIINGTPPDAHILAELHELLRARASAGQPIEDGITVYRRGARLFWEALLDLAPGDGRTVLIAQSDTVWSCLEAYLAIILGPFAQAYADQADAPQADADRQARALFDRLCAQLPVTAGDRDRAARLGFDLAQPSCPFAAQVVGAPVAAHAGLAARLRTAGALAFTENARIIGITPPGFGWAGFLADPRLLLAQDPPAPRAQLGPAADSLRALTAVAARSGHRGWVFAEGFLPELLLADSPWLAARIAGRVFGPLNRASAADLAATLRSLAAHGFDRTATAAALPVPGATLAQRIGRIEDLTGLSLEDRRDRALVLLAAMWEDIAPGAPPGNDASR
jgi:PucR C-terminal helix-turn-helix domain